MNIPEIIFLCVACFLIGLMFGYAAGSPDPPKP